nr:filamentous hemagglutinin N-terminal domain-containing protein [Nitrospirota bacterium]
MSGRRSKALRRDGMIKRRITAVRLKLPSDRWTRGLAAAGLMTGALAPMPSLAFIGPITDNNGHSTNVITGNTQIITSDNSRFIGTTPTANINGGEYVKWYQPSAGSIALLKVAGDSPSIWNGSFWSNGQFMLQNPSGVLFSSSSRVDVASLLVTTLNMKNEDFLAGNYRFSQMAGYANAAVVNQGVITAGPGGYVALLGAAARNEGVIVANAGSIALAAGKAATLDMRGDGLIEFVVTDAVSGSVTGPDGKSLASYVSNTGTLQADGGMVTLTASAATDIIKSVVNNEGVIRAVSMVDHGGVIKLVAAGDNSAVTNYGTLEVSAGEAGATSGNVLLAGPYVGNAGTVSARGADGATGGHVELTSTRETILASGSTIDVSGVGNSNAGSVRIWSDENTVFAPGANLLARGGDFGGDGGLVEVSSRQYFSVNGKVDTSAPRGKSGTFLLDPTDLFLIDGVITTGSLDTQVTVTTPGSIAFGNGGASETVSVGALDSLANTTNITLQATNKVTVGTSGGASATVTLSSLTSKTLTLQAGNGTGGLGNVVFNSGSSITTGGGGVTILAGGAGDTAGVATLGAITTAGGALNVTARTNVSINAALNATAGTVTINFGQTAAGTLTVGAAGTITGGTKSINGGANADIFDFSAAPGVTATLAGGGGSDTLLGRNAASTWTLTATDAGTVASTGTLTFSAIPNLTGGTNTDSFVLNGSTLSGAINGGTTGANTLTGNNVASTWTVRGDDGGEYADGQQRGEHVDGDGDGRGDPGGRGRWVQQHRHPGGQREHRQLCAERGDAVGLDQRGDDGGEHADRGQRGQYLDADGDGRGDRDRGGRGVHEHCEPGGWDEHGQLCAQWQHAERGDQRGDDRGEYADGQQRGEHVDRDGDGRGDGDRGGRWLQQHRHPGGQREHG